MKLSLRSDSHPCFDGGYKAFLPLVAHIKSGCPGVSKSSCTDIIDTLPYVEL